MKKKRLREKKNGAGMLKRIAAVGLACCFLLVLFGCAQVGENDGGKDGSVRG